MRNPHSSAVGCYQLTTAALADVGWKSRTGDWLDNPWNIRSDDEFAANYAAQNAALDHYTALNWQRLGKTRSLVGQRIGDVKVTEGGLLAAAHFLGPGGMRELSECGFRPDCIPEAAAAANGGRLAAFRIVMNRLAAGSAVNAGYLTGVHTPGGGRQQENSHSPGRGVFPPWLGGRAIEQPPLQGQRRHLN